MAKIGWVPIFFSNCLNGLNAVSLLSLAGWPNLFISRSNSKGLRFHSIRVIAKCICLNNRFTSGKMCLPISSQHILRLLLSSSIYFWLYQTITNNFNFSSAVSLGCEASIQAPPVWPSVDTEVTEVTTKSAERNWRSRRSWRSLWITVSKKVQFIRDSSVRA